MGVLMQTRAELWSWGLVYPGASNWGYGDPGAAAQWTACQSPAAGGIHSGQICICIFSRLDYQRGKQDEAFGAVCVCITALCVCLRSVCPGMYKCVMYMVYRCVCVHVPPGSA